MSETKLTYTSALILCVIEAGCYYGFDIMETTGLPSGTVYPALRRLEEAGLVQSKWEKESKAVAEQRPARKYYKLTGSGSDTAANLSGQTGTNQTDTGRENYNIDTKNTDPNKGPMSNNPAVYDDKDLFNLL